MIQELKEEDEFNKSFQQEELKSVVLTNCELCNDIIVLDGDIFKDFSDGFIWCINCGCEHNFIMDVNAHIISWKEYKEWLKLGDNETKVTEYDDEEWEEYTTFE